MRGLSFRHRTLGKRSYRYGSRHGLGCLPWHRFEVVFGDANSARAIGSRRVLRAALPLGVALFAAASAPGVPARASTLASITPSLRPDRPHARAALTLTIHFQGGEAGIPSPLQHAELRLPANVNLDIPELRSCDPTVLQARGPSGCPTRSLIGDGSALVEGELGSQAVIESVTLQAFLGPLHNLQPTFEILASGYRPVGAQRVLGATASPDSAPYGEALAMSVPPISTVPNEPDASVLMFSLTIGRPRAGRHAPAVIVPARCPRGGFPFEGEFTYADGSSSRVYATAPCPR